MRDRLEPVSPAPIPASADELFHDVYDYLRGVAHRYLSAGHASPTLEATGLVHEAYMRLSSGPQASPRWRDREHFCAVAAQAMRHILIDHCRRRVALKRDAGERITLSGIDSPG